MLDRPVWRKNPIILSDDLTNHAAVDEEHLAGGGLKLVSYNVTSNAFLTR